MWKMVARVGVFHAMVMSQAMNNNVPHENDDLSAVEEVDWGLTDQQRAELDRRVARYEQNPSDVIAWEQVKAGLFRKT